MAQVVQAACPGCKQVLRIPLEWVGRSLKCKHCGLTFLARARPTPAGTVPRSFPVRPAPAAALTPPVPPPAVAPLSSSPFADLTAPPPPAPVATAPFDFDGAPVRIRRRRSRGGCWTGLAFLLVALVIAVGVALVAWPYLAQLARRPEVTDLLNEPPGKAVATTEREVKSTEHAPHRPGDTSPEKPAPVVRPPKPHPSPRPPEPPSPNGRFPRRALLISINNYLYFNPVNYGTFSENPKTDIHTLVNQLNQKLHIPLDQVTELSDATPDPAGKRGRGAVAPVKSVIEQTVGDFLTTSRPQDRILILFVGHAVELDNEVYLVPIEGERDRTESLVPLKWLYDRLAACKARQKVLILDVCRFDPSRGFERPGSGSPDAKVEGGMSARIDEALKNPPTGVEVWSACVADQRSLELDNNGVFIDALWKVLARGIDGIIQRPDGSIPVERLVEPVNRKMTEHLTPYSKMQTSRLTGKEPEGGAAYDPAEPPPPHVEPKLPVAAGDAYAVGDLRKLMDEIDLPPIKIAQDDTPLRAESMPPFTKKVMTAYREADGRDTELRKAVKAGVVALNKLKDKHLRDEWDYPGDENRQKALITDYQRKEVAGVQRELDEAMGDLLKASTPEALAAEPRRWQAHCDFVLARLEEELAYLNEYQGLLGQMKKELPPIDRKVQNGWRVASQTSLSDSQAKKLEKDARKLLEKIVKEFPDTPWEVLAKRDKLTALGMEWQAARLRQ